MAYLLDGHQDGLTLGENMYTGGFMNDNMAFRAAYLDKRCSNLSENLEELRSQVSEQNEQLAKHQALLGRHRDLIEPLKRKIDSQNEQILDLKKWRGTIAPEWNEEENEKDKGGYIDVDRLMFNLDMAKHFLGNIEKFLKTEHL